MACAAPRMPKTLLAQLAIGGFLVLPVEDSHGDQNLWRITRHMHGFVRENLGACRFVPLIGRHGYNAKY
jgi:protein-L-isoaspartate(D-aspartate) O-methyltransferase